MLQTCSTMTIDVPAEVVWRVVTDVDAYPEWNVFTIGCRTTWAVGTPIVMKVRLFPRLTIRQRETVRVNEDGRLIEYGIDLPMGLLRRSRRHCSPRPALGRPATTPSSSSRAGWRRWSTGCSAPGSGKASTT